MLRIEPDRGPCNARVMVQGTGFPPGAEVKLGEVPIVPYYIDVGAMLPTQKAGTDGTFAVEIRVGSLWCPPHALWFRISAGSWPSEGGRAEVSARYTVSNEPPRFPTGPFVVTGTPAARPVSPQGTASPDNLPPPATLTYDSASQTGALGDFCWPAYSVGDLGGCAERGLPIPTDVLAVPRGASVTFAIDGIPGHYLRPACAYPLPAVGSEPRCRTVPIRKASPAAPWTITLDVPAGDYALIVRTNPGGGGELTYGFHVVVR